MRIQSLWLCAAGLLLASHSAVSTAAVLDQYSFLAPGTSGAAYTSYDGFHRAQTFTVGMDGMLDSIKVELNRGMLQGPSNVADEMRLLSTSAGMPGSILATSSLRTLSTLDTDTNQYLFGTFDFSALDLHFNAGDLLAFEIVSSGSEGGLIQWYENTYSGGSDFFINPYSGNPNWTRNELNEGIDLAFQTYMTPVPLPPAVLLLVSGLAGLARINRKPRSAR